MPNVPDSSIAMEVEEHGDKVVIRPHGRLREIESQELSREMTTRIEQGSRRLIIHLEDVPFLSSSCLGAFMYAHKLGRDRGSRLFLAEMQPLVKEIIVTTKLHKLFPVFDNLEDALKAP